MTKSLPAIRSAVASFPTITGTTPASHVGFTGGTISATWTLAYRTASGGTCKPRNRSEGNCARFTDSTGKRRRKQPFPGERSGRRGALRPPSLSILRNRRCAPWLVSRPLRPEPGVQPFQAPVAGGGFLERILLAAARQGAGQDPAGRRPSRAPQGAMEIQNASTPPDSRPVAARAYPLTVTTALSTIAPSVRRRYGCAALS